MRIIFSLFLTLFVVTAMSAQLDQNRNSCSDYLRLKKEVDDVTKRIQNEYARDKVFLAKFSKAQASWESYRESQLEMIFPEADKSVYGSSYPTCRCNWLVEITNERLDYLVKWVSGTNDGEVCGGSRNSDKRKSAVKFHE
jgi:Lysozyme inhibitor LprI